MDCLEARNGKIIWEKQLGKDYELGLLQCRALPLIEGNLPRNDEELVRASLAAEQ